ncbi:MAG: hypothetical protein WDN03_16330 [Rhizomicrobium sp.]
MRRERAVAFGLRWESDAALWLFESADFAGSPDVVVALAEPPLRARDEVAHLHYSRICSDGLRFFADREAVIDLFGADRIEVTPQAEWRNAVPLYLFSTVAAVLLARRGLVPVHGTAVEIGGRGLLICGRSGAGKSTLSANLIGLGARLISDDLSVLRCLPGQAPRLLTGRPGMRLHPGTVAQLGALLERNTRAPLHNGKHLMLPPRAAAFAEHPLAGIVILDRDDAVLPPALQIVLLRHQIFRPMLMELLPGQGERVRLLADVARAVGVTRVRDLCQYDEEVCRRRAQETFDWFGDIKR